MTLKLYKYNGDLAVVNKLNNASLVYSSDAGAPFELYGDFDPRTAIFTLAELYEVNYASFDFGGVTYCGFVNPSVASGSLYMYSFFIDEVATAYINGCCNVWTTITRRNQFEIAHFDAALGTRPQSESVQIIDRTVDYDDYAIIINIYDISSVYNWPGNSQKSTPNSIQTYIFPNLTNDPNFTLDNKNDSFYWNAGSVFSKFISAMKTELTAKDPAPFLSSILNAYVVPMSIFLPLRDTLLPNDTIDLTTMPSNIVSALTGWNTLTVKSNSTAEDTGWRVYNISKTDALTASTEFSIAEYRRGDAWAALWWVNIPFIGAIHFRPSECLTADTVKIRVTAKLNAVSSGYTLQLFGLKENSTTWYEIREARQYITVAETLTLPTGGTTSDSGMLSALAGAVATGAAGFATANVAKVAEGVAVAGTSILNAGIHGATGSYGSIGASPERVLGGNQYATFGFLYQPYSINPDVYAGQYGYVCDNWGYLPNQPKGFIQTRNVRFNANGVPFDIVEAAERAYDSGVVVR